MNGEMRIRDDLYETTVLVNEAMEAMQASSELLRRVNVGWEKELAREAAFRLELSVFVRW
jgi:hypothetical protein